MLRRETILTTQKAFSMISEDINLLENPSVFSPTVIIILLFLTTFFFIIFLSCQENPKNEEFRTPTKNSIKDCSFKATTDSNDKPRFGSSRNTGRVIDIFVEFKRKRSRYLRHCQTPGQVCKKKRRNTLYEKRFTKNDLIYSDDEKSLLQNNPVRGKRIGKNWSGDNDAI